jgi:hypothetical protein
MREACTWPAVAGGQCTASGASALVQASDLLGFLTRNKAGIGWRRGSARCRIWHTCIRVNCLELRDYFRYIAIELEAACSFFC